MRSPSLRHLAVAIAAAVHGFVGLSLLAPVAPAAGGEVSVQVVDAPAVDGAATTTSMRRFAFDRGVVRPVASATQSWPGRVIDFTAADDGHCVYWAQHAVTGETSIRGAVRDALGAPFSPTAPAFFGAPEPRTFGDSDYEKPGNVVVSPDGEHAYVHRARYGSGGVVAIFDLDPASCTARPHGAQPIFPLEAPGGWWLSMSPGGRTLLTNSGCCTLSPSIKTIAVAGDGTLSHADLRPLQSGSLTEAITLSADGRHVYATDYGLGRVWQFSLSGDHALTPLDPPWVPAPSGSWGSTFTEDGHLLVADFDGDASITSYRAGADGALLGIGSFPLTGYREAGGLIAIDHDHVLTSARRISDGRNVLLRVDVSSGTWSEVETLTTGAEDYAWGLAALTDRAPRSSFVVHGTTQSVTFDASATTDPDGDTDLTYAWDFGDGTGLTTSSPEATHRYAAPGVYAATLTASDADGPSPRRVANGFQTLRTADVVARRTVTVLPEPRVAPPTAVPPARAPAPATPSPAASPSATAPALPPAAPGPAAARRRRPAVLAQVLAVAGGSPRVTLTARTRRTVRIAVLRVVRGKGRRLRELRLRAGPKGVTTRLDPRRLGRRLAPGRYRLVVRPATRTDRPQTLGFVVRRSVR